MVAGAVAGRRRGGAVLAGESFPGRRKRTAGRRKDGGTIEPESNENRRRTEGERLAGAEGAENRAWERWSAGKGHLPRPLVATLNGQKPKGPGNRLVTGALNWVQGSDLN